MVQKRRHVLWAKAHLKWTVSKCSKWKSVLWSKESKFDILVEITDAVYSGLKRREIFQRVISVQFKSQHLWWYGVHKCIQLACFGRHYECWKVHKGFRATYAPLQTMSISSILTMQNHILQLLQCLFHGFVVEESGCWIGLPAVQIFHL